MHVGEGLSPKFRECLLVPDLVVVMAGSRKAIRTVLLSAGLLIATQKVIFGVLLGRVPS